MTTLNEIQFMNKYIEVSADVRAAEEKVLRRVTVSKVDALIALRNELSDIAERLTQFTGYTVSVYIDSALATIDSEIAALGGTINE